MKNFKKLIIDIVFLTAAAASLTACSGQDSSSGQAIETKASATEDKEGTTADAGEVKVLKIGVSPGSKPVYYYDDNNYLTGLEPELLREVDSRLSQYEFEFVETEYKSLFASLQSGSIDLVSANLRRNEDRENYLHTYRGYNYWANKIVVLDERNDINGIEDLEGKKVGTSQGTLSATFMENYIQETGKDITLVYPSDTISELLSGRIDCFIVADWLVDAVYNKQYEAEGIKLKVVGDPIDTNEGVEKDRNVYWFLSNGNEEARDAISEALYEIRQDGTLSALFEEFVGEDRSKLIDVEQEELYIKEIGK